MFADLVRNRIYRAGDGFSCFICKVEQLTEAAAHQHVAAEHDSHPEELQSFSNLRHFKVDEQMCVELINNGIVVVNSREYRCTFCSCDIPVRNNFTHLMEHLSGKKHLAKRKKLASSAAHDLTYLETTDDTSNEESSYTKLSDDSSCSSHETNNGELNDLTPKDCNNIDGSSEELCNDLSNGCNGHKSSDSTDQSIPMEQSNKCNYFLVACNKCQDVMRSAAALLYHRMFHLSQKSNKPSDIIIFSFKENVKQIHCLVCNCTVQSEEELEKHLNGDVHLKRLLILRCPSNDAIMRTMYMNSTLYPNLVIPSSINNNGNSLNLEFNRYLHYLQNVCHEMVKIQMKIQMNNDLFLPSYFCFICPAKFTDENLLFLHYNYDYVHKYRIELIISICEDKHVKFVNLGNYEIMMCTKCQIDFTKLNDVMLHLFDQQHLSDKSVRRNQVSHDGRLLVTNKALYSCPVCVMNVPNDHLMIQHLNSHYHKIKVQEYYVNANSHFLGTIIFHCPICKMNFFNDKIFLQHLIGHVQHQKSDIPTNNGNVVFHPNTNNIYILPNNLQIIAPPNSTAMQQYYNLKLKNAYPMPWNNFNFNVQNNAQIVHTYLYNPQKITALMNYTNKQQSSYYQNGLVNVKNSSSQPKTKDLISFSPRYVQLCIEKGNENIFTMNMEKLKKLELGISLTFPYDSRRFCIPCCCEVSSDPQLLYEHLRTEEHEQSLQQMEDNEKYFENYQDQFSDLKLAKAYMHEESDDWVKCYACDIKIENNKVNIKDHISSDLHGIYHRSCKESADEMIKLFYHIFENLWYYIDKFSCHLCSTKFEFEIGYAKHLEDSKHLVEVQRRLDKKQTLQFDCCILCSSYWYAKSDHYQQHCSNEAHIYIFKTRDLRAPRMDHEVTELFANVDMTIDQLIKESDEAAISELDAENQILQSIEKVVQPKYPRAKTYLFGSRISNISFRDSDLDIFLDCDNEYEISKSKKIVKEQLSKVQLCIYLAEKNLKIDEIVVHTRVPIIKLKHKPTNLHCDISFINGLGVEKSKILGYFVNACLPCRKMILYLKKWSALCQLSGREGINSFALCWFVIFYLQVKGILPSVHQLIEQENKSHVIAGWETGVSKNVVAKDVDISMKDLLLGFFRYYHEFNYISDVACPFLGKIMKKNIFSDIDKLPDEMSFYKTQLKSDNIEFFRLHSPMCIQDPIDLSQNITKSVTKLHLRMFREYCSKCAVILAV